MSVRDGQIVLTEKPEETPEAEKTRKAKKPENKSVKETGAQKNGENAEKPAGKRKTAKAEKKEN